MNRASRVLIILVIIAATGVFSCSDSEHRIPIGYAQAVISLNIPPEVPDSEVGLIERMRRFLVPDAVAQSAPASFSNITVRVTGPDMALIEKSFAPYSTISLSVPAGELRIFEVTAYVAPGEPSFALSFRGTSSANCPAGKTVSVPVVMGLNETKIVVPDNGNSRVVVKDSMHSGWHVISTFQQPMDIDFDSRGRMYIVDQNLYYVWRLESITDSSPEQVSDTDWLFCLAVDRYRNRIFYSDESDLWQNKLSGGNEQLKNLFTAPATITEIIGMDPGPDGMLYIVGQVNDTGVTNDAIVQYDPDGNSGAGAIVRTSFANTEIQAVLNNPLDIQVKWPYLYVTNSSGGAGTVILKIQVTGNGFTLADSFGTLASTYPDTPAGHFFGPLQFAGLRSDGLVVMDHYSTYTRLVFFGNDLDSGWDTLGGFSGSGVDQFSFSF